MDEINKFEPAEYNKNEIPADTQMPNDKNDADIDEDYLSSYITELFRKDIQYKQDFSWNERRKYEIDTYYGVKDKRLSQWPWPGACDTPIPLTSTLLDTAVANVLARFNFESRRPVGVNPQSIEDVRLVKPLQEYMNYRVMNETDIPNITEQTIFRTFLHGTGIQKVIISADNDKNISVRNIDIDNIFLPMTAEGFQRGQTDHLIQIVPLTHTDILLRKHLGRYKYPDEIYPGAYIGAQDRIDRIEHEDNAVGGNISQTLRNEMYYMAEIYLLEYYPKNSRKNKPLIVTTNFCSGKIQRVRDLKGLVPFSDYHAYGNDGRIFSMSLPEKIKNLQEAANYAFKQHTDALDKQIPAMFIDDTSGFNPDQHQRVPSGVYAIGAGKSISYEPIPPVNSGFERQLQYLWSLAELQTGLIDVIQGRSSASKTLGETEIRSIRADVRFESVMRGISRGWKNICNIIYGIDNENIPRDRKLKIIGYDDYKSLDQIFPKTKNGFGLGIEGNPDFSFSDNNPLEKENEIRNIEEFAAMAFTQRIVNESSANTWRVLKSVADVRNIKDYEWMIPKPKEVSQYSVDEFIMRVMSGEYDIQLRPGIDTQDYIWGLQIFMRSEMFDGLTDEGKNFIAVTLERVVMMKRAEDMALQQFRQNQMDQAISGIMGQMQNGQRTNTN